MTADGEKKKKRKPSGQQTLGTGKKQLFWDDLMVPAPFPPEVAESLCTQKKTRKDESEKYGTWQSTQPPV
jgi:hypothetical protein